MKDVYVSPMGDGNGEPASPCSLERARELVRDINKDMSHDINVYIDDGVYKLTSPLVLSPEDSGTNDYMVRWRNKPGARPVFTGAEEITDWTLHDIEQNIWKASVPENVYFEHLWVNGRRTHRAWSGWNPKGFVNTKRGVKFSTLGPDLSQWRNPEDIVVTKKFVWRHIPCRVQSIHNGEVLLDPACVHTYKVPRSAMTVLDPIGLFLMNGPIVSAADISIENAYELLSEEGEWYLDRSSSTLYYKPFESDEFCAESEALYPVTDTFILLDGTEQNPIRNVAIEGLTFEYCRGTRMGITAGSPTEPTKAIPPKPRNALQINAGISITIQSNVFIHIGADAIHCDLLGRNLKISGNAFGDISRAAISLNQTNLVVSNASKRRVLSENAHKFFDGVEISNNYVRYTGVDDIGAAIVYSEFTRNLKLFHNEIREVPTLAVRGSWRFLAWRKHTGNIEYAWNKTSDVGQAGFIDYGALYISCCNIGESSIHHNFIDGAGLNEENAGIYLDVYTENVRIYRNVCQGMPQKAGSLLGIAGWVGLILSKHNKIYGNWSDSRIKTDSAPSHYRLWSSSTNKFKDNYFRSPDTAEWPEEAREVIDRAGPEPEYRKIKAAIDSVLDKGYMPLAELYLMPGKDI